MPRDPRVVLVEIAKAIASAKKAVGSLSLTEFIADDADTARLAAQRAIEIISEASRHLPPEIVDRHPQIH